MRPSGAAALATGALLVLLVIAGSGVLRAWEGWEHGGEIAVDFDPSAPVESPRTLVGLPRSPDGTLVAAPFGERTVIVDTDEWDAVADLGVVNSAIFVSDDVLAVFGADRIGPEHAALVDLTEQTVDQIEDRGGTNGPLHALRVRDDGLVVVCEQHFRYDAEICGRLRYLLDPEAGAIRLAPFSPEPITDEYGD